MLVPGHITSHLSMLGMEGLFMIFWVLGDSNPTHIIAHAPSARAIMCVPRRNPEARTMMWDLNLGNKPSLGKIILPSNLAIYML
jgi:hypothetical protein